MSVKQLALVLIASLFVGGFIYIGAQDAVKERDLDKIQKVEIKTQQSELKQLDVKVQDLNTDLDKANAQKSVNQAEVERLQREKEELEKQKQQLESEKQSRILEKQRLAQASKDAVNAFTAAQTASATTNGSHIDCNNQTTAKAFIYCHESGNTADKFNSIGCYGLGQDCNNIVHDKCGADYACQDAFFTDYMERRYGSWEKAKAFWQSRVPINGKDVGFWW